MYSNYVLNGQAHGEIGQGLARIHYDTGFRRPYIDSKDNMCVTINSGEFKFNEKTEELEPVKVQMRVQDAVGKGWMPSCFLTNATTLRKDEWIMLDRAVLKATRSRLRAWSDLRASNTFTVPGMSKTLLEHEVMTDVGQANVDMDGVSKSTSDRPHFILEALPLPITHVDFEYTERNLAVSRNVGMPLDRLSAEMAGRRVGESIEDTLIGVLAGLNYGVSTPYNNAPKVYGYKTHPDRITKTDLTAPTGVGTSDDTVADVLTMVDLAAAQNFFGPFVLYTTNDWSKYMNGDYLQGTLAQGLAAPNKTLRQRIMEIEEIRDVRKLDRWNDTTALMLVQMTSEVAQAVNGMEITTLRWDDVAGMQRNFKVMAIQVPRIRSQFVGTSQSTLKTGIVHATIS